MTLMLWFHKKSFSPNHCLKSKFIYQLGQTWIHIIFSFLFMIGHYKVILFSGINELMLWFHKKSISFHHSLELKFICKLRKTQIHVIISSFSMIGHHKHILLVKINDIDDLASQEKFFFPLSF